jgi:hypothetical protein
MRATTAWRQEWADLKELVAEIDRLHAELPPT